MANFKFAQKNYFYPPPFLFFFLYSFFLFYFFNFNLEIHFVHLESMYLKKKGKLARKRQRKDKVINWSYLVSYI
jgi:hypothetical protein